VLIDTFFVVPRAVRGSDKTVDRGDRYSNAASTWVYLRQLASQFG